MSGAIRSHVCWAIGVAGVLGAMPRASNGAVGTVLLAVVDSAAPDAQESLRKSFFESLGYTVTLISASATQAEYDAAVRASSVAYICETIISTTLGTKLVNAPIGVITEESALSDEFGFSATMSTITSNQINIVNTTHYITKTLSGGVQTFASSAQPARYLTGTLGGFTTLGQRDSTSDATLAVFERGGTLTPSGTAAGRRVYLPFGNTGTDFSALNATGRTLVQRSVEWCMMPVAWYKLDDASGSSVVDSASGLNGMKVGATWTTSGRKGGALSFNGTTDCVDIPDNTQFQVTRALTVAGWIKAASWTFGANVSVVLRKGTTTPLNWQLDVANGRLELVLDYYDASSYMGSTVLPTNQWVHVAGTWDGQSARVYVNGVLDSAPYSHTAALGVDTRPVFLGGRAGSTDVTNGVVDDVRFYGRALTAAEVLDLAKRPTLTSWKQSSP